jgi:catechol 2,3-dioxygenase-like lactoylglutathione lyase family enzyme
VTALAERLSENRPVSGERTVPILPCPDLDDALAFYGHLGFSTGYRQLRPNPYGVVRRDDLELHLSGIDGFDPATSYASAIVTVPDVDALHQAFAAGLRAGYGRVPLTGIPRLLRVRRKAGTATGFSLVDPGGNWLRFYRSGATEDEGQGEERGLARVLLGVARQSDARGDHAVAATMLDAGLRRHPDAPPAVLVEALVHRAELALALGDPALARRLLDADVPAVALDADQAAAAEPHLAIAAELRETLER